MWDKRFFGGFEPYDLGLQNKNPKLPQEIQSACVVVVHQMQWHTPYFVWDKTHQQSIRCETKGPFRDLERCGHDILDSNPLFGHNSAVWNDTHIYIRIKFDSKMFRSSELRINKY